MTVMMMLFFSLSDRLFLQTCFYTSMFCYVSFTLTQWSAVYDYHYLTELTDRTDDLEIAYRCDQSAVYCSLKSNTTPA